MIEVVNLSSKGQLVIPKEMREEMGLRPQDKVMLVNDRNAILVKKITEHEMKQRMKNMLRMFASEFKKAGITREDVAREIAAARKER